MMQVEGDLNDKKNSKSRVKVAIRVRPMISRELVSHERSCVQFPSKHEVIIGSDRSYRFDRVFKENSSQQQVYEECIKDLILRCFQGYNAAVLAYGQTGSGKTYTMGTNTTTMDCNEEGMIPRVINEIFQEIQKRKQQSSFNIRASFLQIYNEQIIDLLDGQKNIKSRENHISIREEKDGSVSIHGATQERVDDSAQMLSLLDRGSIRRTTAATMMNETSSRSHAIFTIFLEQQNIHKQDEGFITAKFFFVDLAGSQRIKKTGATGVALKQGININLGLLQLGNVISALALQKTEAQFITYRNSKLTRILQDSLGGNSNTYMIACISPAQTNYEESINTLKYASKAMNIKNKPIINRDPHSAILIALKQKIEQLEEENIKLKQLLKGEGINYQEAHNFKKSNIQEELNSLKVKYTIVQRKNQKIFLELKEEKKRRNQIQIQKYQVQREKDMLTCYLEQIKNNHPEMNFDINEQNVPLIENYLHKINQLQSQTYEKDKINNQLQIQYTKLREITERDEQILIKKNETLYRYVKENKELKKSMEQLKKQVYLANGIEYEQEDELYVIEEAFEEEQSLEQDESFNEEVKSYNNNEENIKTELKRVETAINEKQSILNSITNEQIQLEYKLISQMKEQYHQKINQLEKEKNLLIKQQRSQINIVNANKYSQKIQSLQHDLRDFRNKIKEQKMLQQKVTHQNSIIKNLGNDIKVCKVQKIELNRKLKEDKEIFQKFKQKRTQELMLAKKENNKKEIQIRKLTNQNKKKNLYVLKKNDEIKRIKKLNATLKQLMKPTKNTTKHDLFKQKEMTTRQLSMQQAQLQKSVETCLKSMLLIIDKQYDIAKYKKKCEQIDVELDNLIKEQSSLKLKIERMQMQEDQDYYQHNQKEQTQQKNMEFKMNLNEIQERINNLEENKDFCLKKYEELLQDQTQKYRYNYQTEIIYNPKFDHINIYRQLMKCIFKALNRLLIQNYDIKVINEELNIRNSNLFIEIQQLKQNMIKTNIQNQQNISRLRQEMMMRMYQSYMQEENMDNYENNKVTNNTVNAHCKINEREKKNYEKKIIELTRNNNKLVADLQVWRRKCGIVQDKYQSLRSLFDKDKFIGRPIRQQENNINHTNGNSTQKDLRKFFHNNHSSNVNKSINQNSSMLEQLNNMAQKFKTGLRVSKKSLNYIEESNCDQDDNKSLPDMDRGNLSLNKYKWQCVSTIDAHSSPVLAIKNYKHLLISSATRSIKIWDLEANQLNSDITSINLNSFVKSLTLYSDKQLLAASCDKLITLWDLRTSNNELVIRGHKDEIRAMKIVNNYLFSAGKGLTNSGGLLVWDLRYLHYSNPMEQKERGQDIFSLTAHNNIIYYGTRDHHVRRLNIENMETLTTFQPPHMDTVTGLSICKGYLISGSKDKNLRLWSLDNSIYNLKSTTHAFNDYINTVQNDSYHPLFYSGDRTGQVKVGTIIKEKFQFLGQLSHTQSVNAICSLEFTKGLTATASTDKTIKLWQPNSQTFHQIDTNLC